MKIEFPESGFASITLEGNRTAVSAFGSVFTLENEIVPEGTVLAKLEESVEQAKIQPDGTFRLMGLKPGNTYAVTVESSLIESLLPYEKLVTVDIPPQEEPYEEPEPEPEPVNESAAVEIIDDDDDEPQTPQAQGQTAPADDIAPRHGDIQGLELRGIAKNEKAQIFGSAFFQDEENPNKFKKLYRE